MSSGPPTVEPHVERPGPAEFRDPAVVKELKRAAVEVAGIWSLRSRQRGYRPGAAASRTPETVEA